MADWKDVLVEATKMYELLTDALKLSAAEQPQNEFTKMNTKNLKAAVKACNNMIADINDKIGKNA